MAQKFMCKKKVKSHFHSMAGSQPGCPFSVCLSREILNTSRYEYTVVFP